MWNLEHRLLRRPFLALASCLTIATANAQIVSDQYGNVLPLDSIRFPGADEQAAARGSGGGSFCSTSGIFNIYYLEVGNATGTGFDAPGALGAARRDVVCRVFTDLSLLLQPANDPYSTLPNTTPYVNITVFGAPLPAGVIAAAQVWNNTIALPDGDVNPLDNITTAAQREGVLDGEVWRTINGGHDSWEAYELAENNGANYEHGRITVNFASTTLDLDPGPPIVGTDLYSVIAHEVLHLLGFYTHTGATGNSWFAGQPDPSNYFSRFDLFLNDGSQDHIIDPQACTNWASNVNPVDVTNPCNVFFEGSWTIAPEPIYSPAGWQKGSSLSHLDNQCGGATT